ncbi:MAG TPA: 3-phosphoshikimate 1-carboxyvinyltransferase, partial [Burkholderiaceae bacterium]|nr:3-phosphoshikimate 1-carboxyvinyltransferase [Burkholderiaceae bacterium]
MNAERQWPDELTVGPIAAAGGSVCLPGSKSLSNRALLLAALARGRTRLNHLLEADDTSVMIDALRRLGVGVEADGADWVVSGCDGRWPVREAALFLGNAGTAMRSLTSALAFSG